MKGLVLATALMVVAAGCVSSADRQPAESEAQWEAKKAQWKIEAEERKAQRDRERKEASDRWVKETSACMTLVLDQYKAKYDNCAEKALAEIAPFSHEPSDVVASAV